MDAQAVLGLAPDGKVAGAATKLAGSSGWHGLGRSDLALWGLCKGSGAKPYAVCVDLGDRATKCSCPSRKFPCKHALALQLRDLGTPLEEGEPPDWAREWLDRRKAAAPVDDSPEAVERRARAKERTAAKREASVRVGVAGLTDWLADVAGAGIAALPGREAAWWQGVTARMVDAKAQGLAAAVENVRAAVAAGGSRWAHDAADRLGGLHLLTRLAGTDSAVVRRRLGYSVTEEEVRAAPGMTDRWISLLRRETDEGRFRTLRQWAWGREHGWVLAERHARGDARPVPVLPHGVELHAVLHRYPGSSRVALGEVITEQPLGPVPASASWVEALAGLEPALLADPWERVHPVSCAGVRLSADATHAVDAEGRALRIHAGLALDQVVAITGGTPFDLWALWDGETLRPGAVALAGDAPEVLA
ncbi:SWIM zinc finger family protein [Saccharothrix violaceirubra]|uniref:SWIM-type domain-containing protein n=1 Tax=Saccharothrix violaceirubra TaxID=413306 RepID=A0A7W7T9S1_9PSEU|nr:SWIM zinc finger family protein [Saccharothrix violaceirubra]MBB4969178.1 hypothetical protein [Saccharothrix violaceirubra]